MHRKRRGRKRSAHRVVLTDGRILCDGVSPAFAAGFVRAWNRMIAAGEPRAFAQQKLPGASGMPPPDGDSTGTTNRR